MQIENKTEKREGIIKNDFAFLTPEERHRTNPPLDSYESVRDMRFTFTMRNSGTHAPAGRNRPFLSDPIAIINQTIGSLIMATRSSD